MPSKPRQSVTLSAPQYEWLRETADELGISVSDLIRRIVDEFRETKGARAA